MTSKKTPSLKMENLLLLWFNIVIFLSGQERFRSVTRSYYRGAAGALLVYDITSRESYNALNTWLSDARNLASPNIAIILVGNKKDLEEEREVTFLEASRFAQDNELLFLETSALTGDNVEETFLKCARSILMKIESGDLDPERMGSGIQYGDASLRRLNRTQGSISARRDCSCWNCFRSVLSFLLLFLHALFSFVIRPEVVFGRFSHHSTIQQHCDPTDRRRKRHYSRLGPWPRAHYIPCVWPVLLVFRLPPHRRLKWPQSRGHGCLLTTSIYQALVLRYDLDLEYHFPSHILCILVFPSHCTYTNIWNHLTFDLWL